MRIISSHRVPIVSGWSLLEFCFHNDMLKLLDDWKIQICFLVFICFFIDVFNILLFVVYVTFLWNPAETRSWELVYLFVAHLLYFICRFCFRLTKSGWNWSWVHSFIDVYLLISWNIFQEIWGQLAANMVGFIKNRHGRKGKADKIEKKERLDNVIAEIKQSLKGPKPDQTWFPLRDSFCDDSADWGCRETAFSQ